MLQETIGPTPEQMAKGGYTKPEGRGTRSVYTNINATYLDRLRNSGSITKRQHAGGEAFERTYVLVWGSMSSSADSTVHRIGGVSYETEGQAARMAQAKARLHTILNRVGPRIYDLLRETCVRGTPLGKDRGKAARRYEELRHGCNVCAIVYGLQEDAA